MGQTYLDCPSKHHSVVLASNMAIKATYIFAFLALMVHLSDAGNCYKEDDKSSYTGFLSMTKSGRTCQLWESQTPHKHSRGNSPSSFVDGRFPDNFCRTPEDGVSVIPWCYTTDVDKRWEHCDVPSCVTVHVESGILECGNAVDWWDGEVEFDGHTYDFSKHITVNFDQTYESPPTVFLSEVSRNINTGNRRDIYGVGVLEVTTTGFTMACGSYGVESWHIFYSTLSWLTVSWLSVS